MINSARDFEKTIAKILGGKVIPASGAGAHFKGDVITDEFLVECKQTDKMQYILKLDDYVKIKTQANLMRRTPAMVVGFGRERLAIVDVNFLVDIETMLKGL